MTSLARPARTQMTERRSSVTPRPSRTRGRHPKLPAPAHASPNRQRVFQIDLSRNPRVTAADELVLTPEEFDAWFRSYDWRVQSVSATVDASFSAGVMKPRVFRGRMFRRRAMALSWPW